MINAIEKVQFSKFRIKDISPSIGNAASPLKFKEERKQVEGFISNSKHWNSPEYDLSESGRVLDVESLVRRSYDLKHTLMFKEGWTLAGNNPQTVDYIRARFRQMAVAQGEPIDLFFRNTGRSYVRVSNAFILKSRKEANSGGKAYREGDRIVKPISALFEIPPESISYKKDKNKVQKWTQDLSTLESMQYGYLTRSPDKEWKTEDVIHMYRNRKAGFVLGTPDIVPVLDDIRALRRIEQNVELLVYQHIYPVYQYKIGTDALPARETPGPDGKDEITKATQLINQTPPEGMFVTSHRHDIKAIGSEGKALKAKEYLDHFFRRVLIGLGVSEVDLGLGDTSNRSTSETISKNLLNLVKGLQKEFELFINECLISELLKESNFSFDVFSKENLVYFRFNEIDIDKKIKVENHMVNLYQGNAITENEVRIELGKDVLNDEERKQTFVHLVEIPKIEAKGDANMDKGAGAAAQIKSRSNPTNQNSDSVSYIVSSLDQLISSLSGDLKESYSYSQSIEWRKTLIDLARIRAEELFIPDMKSHFYMALEVYGVNIQNNNRKIDVAMESVESTIKSSIQVFIKRVEKKLASSDLIETVDLALDSSKFLLRFLDNIIPKQVQNYAFALSEELKGTETLKITSSETDCETCLNFKDKLLFIGNGVEISSIPPWHYNCNCKLTKVD